MYSMQGQAAGKKHTGVIYGLLQKACQTVVLGEQKPHARVNSECKKEEMRRYTWVC